MNNSVFTPCGLNLIFLISFRLPKACCRNQVDPLWVLPDFSYIICKGRHSQQKSCTDARLTLQKNIRVLLQRIAFDFNTATLTLHRMIEKSEGSNGSNRLRAHALLSGSKKDHRFQHTEATAFHHFLRILISLSSTGTSATPVPY